MHLLLFNPENDLALAANDAHYTPPASARRMAREMASFTYLWDVEEERIMPWGWSPLAVEQLRQRGVPEGLLPTAAQVEDYRQAASRQTAVELLRRLREEWAGAFADGRLVGRSRWCSSEAEIREACRDYGAAMLKAPWSGSGRGVHPIAATGPGERDLAWARRILATQGGVEAEPLYEREADCALEFWAEAGSVRYEGLSLFETTDGGVYRGNLVATEAEKRRRMAAWVEPATLDEVRRRLEVLLTEARLPAWYAGPVGVDMMVVRAGGRRTLHPLVEVNLRMTMGWVALRLARRLGAGETGSLRIGGYDGRYQAVFTKNAG